MDCFYVGVVVSYLFLIAKEVIAPHRQKCGQLLLSSRPNAFIPNNLHRRTLCKIEYEFVLPFTSVGLSAQTPSPFLFYVAFFII